jgi:hypothetical protein
MTSNRSAFVNRFRYSGWMKLFTDAGLEVIQESTTQNEIILQYYQNKTLIYLGNYSEKDAITSYLSIVIKKRCCPIKRQIIKGNTLAV